MQTSGFGKKTRLELFQHMRELERNRESLKPKAYEVLFSGDVDEFQRLVARAQQLDKEIDEIVKLLTGEASGQ